MTRTYNTSIKQLIHLPHSSQSQEIYGLPIRTRIHKHTHTHTQTHKHTNTQTHKRTNTQTHIHPYTHTYTKVKTKLGKIINKFRYPLFIMQNLVKCDMFKIIYTTSFNDINWSISIDVSDDESKNAQKSRYL